MAEHDDDQERTERATEKRLRDAREKGDVPRSRDLSAALIALASVGTLLVMRPWLGEHLRNLMRIGLAYGPAQATNSAAMGAAATAAGAEALKLLAPLFGVALLATLLAPALAGGFAFSTEALVPKPERLNPIEGLKRLISLRGLVELGKSILKVVLIGGVLTLVLWQSRVELLDTGRGNVHAGIDTALDVIGRATLLFCGALAVVGLADMLWQRFDYARRMRMTRQEQRDEHKETEGSPETRSRVRNVQQQMAQRRMMEAVPKADVVVLNPTHFAVALKYDDGMRAPRVVAKGLDLVAARIRGVAGQHEVPLVSAPALARALYHTTRIGQEVPAALYVAVAQILAYVFRVRDAAAQAGDAPPPPNPDIDPQLLGPYQLPDRGQ
ncbi:MAG TPA: flagellar biosynthesis protein FlhB [Rhodanobacteraceae bacterium]|nr:flagellar biosynthesis protein FlhB [Oleiagrimonas sp.]HET9819513.1 flagellar biosynthesis protein FlhB [Rhodanobacteraceae bacterium]